MDSNFWLQKWQKNEIAFHQSGTNHFLVKHFGALSLKKGNRVFVPLCGKTLDIAWLLSRGFRVAGAELASMAIEQLFAELGVAPKISEAGKLKLWSAKDIDIFVGDLFDLSQETLGPVDALYDRAALVALPKETRARYAAHIQDITGKAPQLLLSYEYDQTLMEGPPFSVSGEEVSRLYGGNYAVTLLESAEVPGGLKGKGMAKENVWMVDFLAH